MSRPPELEETGTTPHFAELQSVYRNGLLNDTLPFWFLRAVDKENGGFMLDLDVGTGLGS